MVALNKSIDLLQSITSLQDLRKTFEDNTLAKQLSETVEESRKIEEENKEYLEAEEEKIRLLKDRVDDQRKQLSILTDEISNLQRETNSVIEQDKLVRLVTELDDMERENLHLKNRNDTRVNELASTFNRDHPDSNVIGSIIDQDETIETKKILENPVSKANILKLKLFRSLGMILDEKKQQVFIEGNDKLDVLMLNEGYSDYFKTKYIWERIRANKDSPDN